MIRRNDWVAEGKRRKSLTVLFEVKVTYSSPSVSLSPLWARASFQRERERERRREGGKEKRDREGKEEKR